jgi:uncharacterized membrane protein YdjX (TVP38/TMEM64 family)
MHISNEGKFKDGRSSKLWWGIGLGLLVLVMIIAWYFLPISDWIKALQSRIDGFGRLALPIFALAYIAAVVVLVPGSVLTIGAGLAYGAWGFPVSIVSATIGASLAFLIARYLAHGKVHALIGDRKRLKAVERAVSEDGWKIVGLVRLSPLVPFNVQNYFFGITDIPFWHYVAATFVGMIPGTVVNVYIGMLGGMASNDSNIGSLQWGFFGLGLIASIIVAYLITRKAKTKLSEIGIEAGN